MLKSREEKRNKYIAHYGIGFNILLKMDLYFILKYFQ